MDQDSFRRLLETPRPSTKPSALGAASTSRSRLVVQSRQKTAAEVVSKPAFKPRNIRKPEVAKDRKIPQDERINTDNNIDVEHLPSKGLDFALLEQERAKASQLSTNDVDELEQAFAESSAVPNSVLVAPRKRTREDLIRELKQRRTGDAGPREPSESIKADLQLEEAKQKGKFKPIGFTSTSKRKKDGANTADGMKKKRKVDNDKNDLAPVKLLTASATDTAPTKTTPEQPKPSAEDSDDNFDIFAGAGEYTGVEIDEHEGAEIATPQPPEVSSSLPQRWIALDEPKHVPQAKPQLSSQLPIPIPKCDTDQEVEPPIRLAPLESSAVPSIKELLDLHDAADKYEKKLKRKEKKQRKRGGNGKGSDDNE